MCGHATIAGVHALVESGRLEKPTVETSSTVGIDTRSGLLTAFVERLPASTDRHMIWLDLIDPVLEPVHLPEPELVRCLGLSADRLDRDLPTVRSQDGDAIVFVKDFAAVNAATPDFSALARFLTAHGLRGLCLATIGTLTPSIHVQSRFFAPGCGVNEDPVTGSVHGPLAAYVVQRGRVPLHDGLAALSCTQAKAGGRAGLVHALVQPQEGGRCAVRIGGQAVTTMCGTLRV